MKGRWAVIGGAVILLLPLVIWGLLSSGRNQYKRLPILGPFEVAEGGDTIWHRLPTDFMLLTQDSLLFTADSLRGRIHVADYFFTRCPGICPRLSTAMQTLQRRLEGHMEKVKLISYTVDPTHDQPSVLRAYAARYQADPRRWLFVTGTDTTLYRLATKGYLIPADKANDTIQGELGYIHSDMLVLVDPDLRIRGFYSGLDSLQIKKLMDDLILLSLEYGRAPT